MKEHNACEDLSKGVLLSIHQGRRVPDVSINKYNKLKLRAAMVGSYYRDNITNLPLLGEGHRRSNNEGPLESNF